MLQRSQRERVAATREQVHLGGHAGLVERARVHRAVADPVDRIVPGLQQEGRRRALRHLESGVERLAAAADVAREEGDREIGPAADLVDRVDRRIRRLEQVAGLCDQVAACREPHHADPVRVDAERLCLRPDQADRALRILQRARDLGRDAAVAAFLVVVVAARHAVLGQHAGDAAVREPFADLGALERDRERHEAATGEDHDRGARAAAPGGVHGHGRRAHVEDRLGAVAMQRLRRELAEHAFRWLRRGVHAGGRAGPDRPLPQARWCFPDAGFARLRRLRAGGVRGCRRRGRRRGGRKRRASVDRDRCDDGQRASDAGQQRRHLPAGRLRASQTSHHRLLPSARCVEHARLRIAASVLRTTVVENARRRRPKIQARGARTAGRPNLPSLPPR